MRGKMLSSKGRPKKGLMRRWYLSWHLSVEKIAKDHMEKAQKCYVQGTKEEQWDANRLETVSQDEFGIESAARSHGASQALISIELYSPPDAEHLSWPYSSSSSSKKPLFHLLAHNFPSVTLSYAHLFFLL